MTSVSLHKKHLTPIQRTELIAQQQGYIVKKNAVVLDGLMPSGILVRREEDKEFMFFKICT